jgi:aryl carrier-like protein
MNEIAKREIKISDFPPKLRKLVQYILENSEIESFDDAINKLGMNLQSIRTMKSRLKRRGIDIDVYLHEKRLEKLKRYSPYVYDSLVTKAITGSLGHQKLFSELLGDRRNKLQIDHNITGLFAVFSGSTIPEDYQDDRKKMKPNGVQIVDIEIED